ncbi:plasmid transfer protein TraA [Streptomyces sp. NBC_01214]|uniref:plasmid transfer protein TraA n=1 Tax=Streptomyces sp. NBC_01214 TaxID=2903777 RepID=UPI0022530797|nr:plasmid transfer protein TraA [Streptomyces sp. NBC_01214]MCX4801764.1 plasmid transfer protein TraA [Streptomyces sp. NBC_01214]
MTTTVPPQSGAHGAQAKKNMTKNSSNHFAGFAPSFGLNINVQGSGNGQQSASGGSGQMSGGNQPSHFMLGEPSFNTTDEVRAYCNHVRAVMVHAAIELAMAAKILEARLGQAQSLPGDNPIQGRLRARKVGRQLKKASGGATSSAKAAVAAYAAFTREYADLMRPRPQQAASTNPFTF